MPVETGASAGTLLVRLATLWFAVAVGLAALVWLNKVMPTGTAAGERAPPALEVSS